MINRYLVHIIVLYVAICMLYVARKLYNNIPSALALLKMLKQWLKSLELLFTSLGIYVV